MCLVNSFNLTDRYDVKQYIVELHKILASFLLGDSEMLTVHKQGNSETFSCMPEFNCLCFDTTLSGTQTPMNEFIADEL